MFTFARALLVRDNARCNPIYLSLPNILRLRKQKSSMGSLSLSEEAGYNRTEPFMQGAQ